MTVELAGVHHHEIEELILYAYGKTEAEVEKFINDGEDIDEFITDKLEDHGGVFDFICDFVNRIMPKIEIGTSPISDETFKGFGNSVIDEAAGKKHITMICKMLAK